MKCWHIVRKNDKYFGIQQIKTNFAVQKIDRPNKQIHMSQEWAVNTSSESALKELGIPHPFNLSPVYSFVSYYA